MLVNIIKSCRDVVTICDTELLGKYFEQNKFQLDLKSTFYKGEEKDSKETLKVIKDMSKEDATFNIVGKDSIKCALKSGIISQKQVQTIANIPFVLVLL